MGRWFKKAVNGLYKCILGWLLLIYVLGKRTWVVWFLLAALLLGRFI